jgi:hypothetical protein
MIGKGFLVPATLSLALVALPAALGAQPHAPEGEGWRLLGEGYWTRTLEDGTVEAEAFGRAGLLQALDRLNAELVNLVDAYLSNPTEDMAEVLDTHLSLIKGVEEGILTAGEPKAPSLGLRASCSTSWNADAGPTSGCGNFATGSSSYFGDSAAACFGTCDLYSYAYVERRACDSTLYTASQSCSKPGVINQSCSSYASLTQNSENCYAYGYASIYCPTISWLRTASDTSTSCGSSTTCGCSQLVCEAGADCTNNGGGSISCQSFGANDCFSWDDCYVYCDGTFYDCPNASSACPYF